MDFMKKIIMTKFGRAASAAQVSNALVAAFVLPQIARVRCRRMTREKGQAGTEAVVTRAHTLSNDDPDVDEP